MGLVTFYSNHTIYQSSHFIEENFLTKRSSIANKIFNDDASSEGSILSGGNNYLVAGGFCNDPTSVSSQNVRKSTKIHKDHAVN